MQFCNSFFILTSFWKNTVGFNYVGVCNGHLTPQTGATAVVERSLLRINEALDEIRNEQSYLRTRERVHRDSVP